MESVLKNEIYDIGYEISSVEDGRVTFIGDAEAIVRANIMLRTAERILLKTGSFHAETFEELFQGTKALPWEEFLPKDAKFWVTKAARVKSKLFSPSDIQSVMKKAMVARMSQKYHIEQFPEDGASYPVRVFLKKTRLRLPSTPPGNLFIKEATGKPWSKRRSRRIWQPAFLCLRPGVPEGSWWIPSAVAAPSPSKLP